MLREEMKCSHETREDRKKMKNKGKQRTNGINVKHLQIWYVNPAQLIITLKAIPLRVPVKRQKLSE